MKNLTPVFAPFVATSHLGQQSAQMAKTTVLSLTNRTANLTKSASSRRESHLVISAGSPRKLFSPFEGSGSNRQQQKTPATMGNQRMDTTGPRSAARAEVKSGVHHPSVAARTAQKKSRLTKRLFFEFAFARGALATATRQSNKAR